MGEMVVESFADPGVTGVMMSFVLMVIKFCFWLERERVAVAVLALAFAAMGLDNNTVLRSVEEEIMTTFCATSGVEKKLRNNVKQII